MICNGVLKYGLQVIPKKRARIVVDAIFELDLNCLQVKRFPNLFQITRDLIEGKGILKQIVFAFVFFGTHN